eukprot:5798494-Prorocentrum_lima.AAC.1
MKEHFKKGGKRGFLMIFWNLNDCFTQHHVLKGHRSPIEMVTILDKIRSSVRQMAMMVANIPGHKVLFVGGSAHDWGVNSLFDQYATSARH